VKSSEVDYTMVLMAISVICTLICIIVLFTNDRPAPSRPLEAEQQIVAEKAAKKTENKQS
jgi:hypothetical protein